jgi:hypothetical protein
MRACVSIVMSLRAKVRWQMNIFANYGNKKTSAITMSQKGDDMAQYSLLWLNKNKSICQQINRKLGYESFKEMHFNLSSHDNLETFKKLI